MKNWKKNLKCDLFIIIMSQVEREKLGAEMAAGGEGRRGQYSAPLLRCSFRMIARKAPGVLAYRNSTSTPALGFMNKVAFSHSISMSGFLASKMLLNFLTLCVKQNKAL